MFEQAQIEKATTEEIISMLEFFRRDIRHAESWLRELKQTENTLKTVLRLKNGKKKKRNMTALKRQFFKCGLKQKTL